VLWRGIRYRAGRSAVVLGLAVVAVAAAVLAPVYSRAAQQSLLADALTGTPPAGTGLTVAATGTAAAAPAAHQPLAQAAPAARAALAEHPDLAAVLGPPVAGVDTDALVTGGEEPVAARLAFRDRVCEHLIITGACPTEPGQALVSARTAAVGIGDPIDAGGRDLVVVGTYRPVDPRSGYWGRTVYFTHGGFDPVTGQPRTDAIFTGAAADVQSDPDAVVTLALTYPLRPAAVRLDRLAGLRADLRALPAVGGMEVDTELPAVLDEAAREQRSIGRTAPIVAVPLLVLAWSVLFLLVAAVTEERGREIGLAKLRGFPAGAAARFGLGEVLLLVLVATPIGVAAGLATVEVAARLALAPGTRVEWRWPVAAAAVLALAGAALAAGLAGRATLRRGALDLLRRVPGRTRWRAGVVEGFVAALAAACLAVAARDPEAPLGLLAPAAVAVLAGLAAGRLVRFAAGVRLRRPRRLSGLLAAAQLARRPAGARVVAVVAVAVTLLTFAVVAWGVAAQARRERATDALGAHRVYTVEAEHPAALVAAVRAASPAGTAMAAVRTTRQYAGAPVELLAVDTTRLAGVAVWRGQDAGPAAAALRPREPAPLPLEDRIEVMAAAFGLGDAPVRLTAVVSSPGAAPRPVPLGTLQTGTNRYAARLTGCQAGCRLLGLGLGRVGVAGTFTASVRVTAIRSGGELPARFDDPQAWSAPGEVSLAPGAALTVTVNGAADVVLTYQETPVTVPVLLAGPAPADDPAAAGFGFPGLGDRPDQFTVVGRPERLPRAGERGLLVDLDYAVGAAEHGAALADATNLRYEVWASSAAPADLPVRLAEHGIAVRATESVAGELAALGRRAPALGFRLSLLAAVAAVAVGIGAVLLYRPEPLPGVPGPVRRRADRLTYAVLAGWPVLLGGLAGATLAAVLLPGIPLVEVA
jgi:putative ABC transport system permease protein